MSFESSLNEINADIEYGWKSGGNGSDEQINIDQKHFEFVRVGPNNPEINEIHDGGQNDDDVDEVDGLFEKTLLLSVLIFDSS